MQSEKAFSIPLGISLIGNLVISKLKPWYFVSCHNSIHVLGLKEEGLLDMHVSGLKEGSVIVGLLITLT